MLVDANQHVDREGAVRAGVGFYGKNTMLITRRHGSWVVLGTLVTDVEIEASPPLDLDCGDCRLCIDACPTDALEEPGTLDATRCLSYWTQSPASIPEQYREPLGEMVYGCDICQEVCPWNRGVEKRRADEHVQRRADRLARRLAHGRRGERWRNGTTACTSRATIPATCVETRWSSSETSAGTRTRRSPSRTRPPPTTRCSRSMHVGPSAASPRGSSVSPEQRLSVERRLAWVRLAVVPFAILEAGIAAPYPAGRAVWVWATVAVFAVGAGVFLVLVRRKPGPAALARIGLAALVFDFALVSSFILALAFQPSVPAEQVMILVLVEAAFRYGIRGGLALAALSVPVLVAFEWLRADHFDQRFRWENVIVQVGVEVVIALLVGWLVERLRAEASLAEDRVHEAEQLRDELERRSHLLDAANRCARALGSSLELDEAFGAFIEELEGFVPFDRTAIILSDEGQIRVMATAGLKHDEVLQPGEALPPGALVEEVLRTGETAYRRDMRDHLYPEEATLTEIGLRSRVAAPLLLGERPIGMLAILRRKPDAFDEDEIELAALLGRLLASGVQNIRAYEAERATVAELRRLSTLRADFVSLVSHELRSPMAAVIGAARTLEERWRELTAEQRAAFLALIADETNRLATLIGDVLDTSRIEAGTFSYRFGDVDITELVRDTVAGFALQEEVTVVAHADRQLPKIQGDRERLRQVLQNLLENAVKYSRAGEEVDVRTRAENGRVLVTVEDAGPGIPREQQGLIFERFGRANVGLGKPGTGLGLFIARSIAEAHGGRLTVESAPGEGATFTLELPASASPQRRRAKPAGARGAGRPRPVRGTSRLTEARRTREPAGG